MQGSRKKHCVAYLRAHAHINTHTGTQADANAFTSDLQIGPTTLIYPLISMHCCNGTESRHLINMPFIWPLHSSLKQESESFILAADLAAKCSQQKLCGSFAIATFVATAHGQGKDLGQGLVLALQKGHSFILLFSFICMSFVWLLRFFCMCWCVVGMYGCFFSHVCQDASYLWLLCALSICIVRQRSTLYILSMFSYLTHGYFEFLKVYINIDK